MLIKNMMGPSKSQYPGLKVWQRAYSTLTLTTKAEYALQASGGDLAINPPVKIINISYRDSNSIDYPPMTEMTIDEYDALSKKYYSGTPTKYIYERQTAGNSGTDRGFIRFNYSIPSGTTAYAVFSYLRPIEDIDSLSNDFDFPQHWFRPLKWMLACELAPEYGQDITPSMQNNMQLAIDNAIMVDPEYIKIGFEPYRSRR